MKLKSLTYDSLSKGVVILKKLIILLLVALFLAGCVGEQNEHEGEVENTIDELPPSQTQLKEPPELIVRSNNHEVLAVLGTYSWSYNNRDGTSTGIEADSGPPPELVTDQENRLNTKLGAEISLDFDHDPLLIEVYIWGRTERSRKIAVEDLTFLTDQTGDIIYEIYAKWNRGTAHYAIEINVD